MKPQTTTVSPMSLEDKSSAVVGKIVFSISRFEFNLGLLLRYLIAYENATLVDPRIEKLTFKNKLDALIEVISLKFPDNPSCVADFREWHRKMDAFRVKRNTFIHGRWGFNDHAEQIINVSSGLSANTLGKETSYSLPQLHAELSEIEEVVCQFHELRKKWSL